MRKLTFERAVLIVFILIILISTSDTTLKYIDKWRGRKQAPIANTGQGRSPGFATMLNDADTLYKAGNYEKAADEYLRMILNSTLRIEQKAHAYFRLGVCQYNLKNYERATDSFIKVTSFNPDDSVAYNNAAVSAYRNNDIKKAIELQLKALDILPAVEYYYNLGRMYEENEEYDQAASSYLVVAEGEQNITKTERIDPVRVKEKVARLMSKTPSSVSQAINNVLIALRLNDTSELLTINENEMQLKQGDFTVKVINQKEFKNITAEYDRKKYDPYNLISTLTWTIYKDGKQLYKKNGDKISADTKDSGNYEIKLSIKYNGNKEMTIPKTVRIKENKSTIDSGIPDEVVVKQPVDDNMKTYVFAAYEQLFESDFRISDNGYTDKYSVVWGKDSGVATSFNKKLVMDKSSSLVIANNSDDEAGLWINLDSLLKEGRIKGKTVNISFYAREIADNSDLDISVRVKTNNMIATTPKIFQLPYQFEQKSIRVYIPEDATGFTISIKTRGSGEFNIDAFTIID